MEPAELGRVATEALYLALLLSAPALLTSLVVGLFMGLLQAVTQIQEQTLAFVPKLAAVAVALATFGGLMGAELVRFASALFESLARIGVT